MLNSNASAETSRSSSVGREHSLISTENARWYSSNHLPRHNFRGRYLDAYTGELLPKHLIRAAIEDELNYLNSKVWKLSSIDEMMKVPDHVLVSSRWVMCNKGDAETPDCRARTVSCEINKDGRQSGCFRSIYSTFKSKEHVLCKVCLA